MIGLSFEPAERKRGISDIEGTLWLERDSGKLQVLQFSYTNLPYSRDTAPSGGRVEFEALPGGAWIVKKWWILMPTVSPSWTVQGPLRRVHYEVTSFKEAGGEVRQVFAADELLLRELPQGILSGAVWDSIRGHPLAGATVSLSGTPYASVTDSAGRFSMMELPEGVYTAGVTHPLLDSLGVAPPGVEVEITSDQLTEVELGVPSMETILAAICEPADQDGAFTLVGTVRLSGSGEPIPKAVVTAQWTKRGWTERNEAATDRGFARLTTDAEGRYVFCGLPLKTRIEVSASFMEHVGKALTIGGNEDSHVVLDLELDLPPGTLVFRTSTEGLPALRERQGIQGRVVDPISGRPVPEAAITIQWNQGNFVSTETADVEGFFSILSPWAGAFTLEATALGYEPVRSDSVEIEPGALTVIEIEMPADPITVDPLVVVAERRAFQLEVNGFYERAEQGFGQFITPEKIEARQAVEIGDLLRDVPGIMLERTFVGTRVLFTKPDLRGDFCNPRLYVDGVLIFQQSPFDEPDLAGTYLDLVVPLGDIAGMEVHTRATSIPLAYGGTQGSCGVILIWTKGG